MEKAKFEHDQFNCQPAGLFINKNFHILEPHHGLITRLYCGDGLIEIKCPFKHRDKDPTTVIDNDFCLQPDSGWKYVLIDYYAQVQGQIVAHAREYCDFICWMPHGMYVERITRNPAYFDSVISHC